MFGIHQNIHQKLFSWLRNSYYLKRIMVFVSLIGALTVFGLVLKNFVFAEPSNPVGILNVEYRNGNQVEEVSDSGEDEFRLRPPKRSSSALLEDVFATVSISAEFGAGTNKKITVKVPTGIAIKKYSAKAGTPDMSGVEKIEIDNEYKDYVLASNLTAATSDTHILNAEGRKVKVCESELEEDCAFGEEVEWDEQLISGYSRLGGLTNLDQRTYGGDITWEFTDETTIMHLTFSVAVDNYVLNHTSTEELLGKIVVEMSSSAEENETVINGIINKTFAIKAINLQTFGYSAKNAYPGTSSYNITGISQDLPNYSKRFGVATAGNSFNSVSSYQVFLADEVIFTFEYYPGVYYDNLLDLSNVGQTLVSDRESCGKDCRGATIVDTEPCPYGECYKEVDIAHGKVVIDQAEGGGGTITITLNDTRHRHMNNTFMSGGVRMAAFFRADNRIYNGDNSTVTVNGDWEYKRNKASSHSTVRREWIRTLMFDDGGIDITIQPKTLTLRNYDGDYENYPYNYILGGFVITSALSYNDIRMEFDFSDVVGKMGVDEVAYPGNNLRDIVCETTNGRVIEIEEQEISDDDDLATVTYGFGINKNDLGLVEGEYIKKIAVTMDMPSQGAYNVSNYTSNAGSYYGHFLDVEDGEVIDKVRLSVVDNDGNILINSSTDEEMTSLGKTTVGWINNGVTSMTASTSLLNTGTGTSSAETTFYPNQTILFKSSLRGSNYVRSGTHIVDPTIIISLPNSISLDTASVKVTSNGRGIAPVELQQSRLPEHNSIIPDWTIYYFKAENPLSIISLSLPPHHYMENMGQINVEFKATVNNSIDLMNLSMKDILSYDLGQTAVKGESTNNIYPDTFNKTGKNTDDSVYYLAAVGGNIVIKPLVGLNIDIGIRTKGYNQDFVTYNGQDSSVVAISRDHAAEVEIKYHSTSTSDFKKNTVIYMPIPKKGMDYDKYFENMSVDNPSESSVHAEFEYSTKLASIPTMEGDDGTEWTTYFTTQEIKSNEDYNVGDASWEPAITVSNQSIEWTRADEFDESNLGAVTMMKFVANGEIIPDSTGRCVYDLKLNSTVEREMDAVNYWRTYNKSVTNEDNTGIWGYSSIIAASADGVSLEGQLFVDRNDNAIFQNPDTAYRNGGYRVYLIREDGTESMRELVINEDGSFTNRAKDGDNDSVDFTLKIGDYVLRIVKDDLPDNNFVLSGIESEYRSNSQNYYNDVNRLDSIFNNTKTQADYYFTIDEDTIDTTNYTFYVGVGLTETNLTLVYEWTGDVPSGVELPTDDGEYESGTVVEINDEYTNQTEIVGELDGKKGIFTFSGWEKDDNIDDENRILNNAVLSGTWEFTPYLTVSYEWTGDVPSGVELPIDDAEYLAGDEVTIDDEYTNQTEIVGELDGKRGIFTFSGWEKDDNIDDDDKILGDATITGTWKFTPEVPEIIPEVPDTGHENEINEMSVGISSVIATTIVAVSVGIATLIKRNKRGIDFGKV